MSVKITPYSTRARDLLILALLTLLVSLPGLGRIPAIDRDEARYAQATVQMLETDEYVDIRFQQNPRWKKPAGAYWAQALSVKAFSSPEARAIWAHRLPSVIGALLAVFATYLAGLRLVGRRGAWIGAALIAVSFCLVYEAHAAKTDALLAGFGAICFAALAYLRHSRSKREARWASIIFWAALGAGVMMKGPISVVIVILTLIVLLAWERKARWLKPLLFPIGPALFLGIVLPWMILIYQKTGGAFFSTAVGEDLAPKLAGGAEKHGGLPGYYLLTTWVFFWPGVAFLLPGISFAVRALWKTPDKSATIPRGVIFMLAWIIPWWILVEIAPTKLPHYTLPIYPALALLAGAAAGVLFEVKEFKITRIISATLYGIFGILLACLSIAAIAMYGDQSGIALYICVGIAIAIVLLICVVTVLTWIGKGRPATLGTIASGVALWMFTFGMVLPSLNVLTVSDEVRAAMNSANIKTPLSTTQAVYSPHFSEPSLVFALGTHIKIGGDADVSDLTALKNGDFLIADMARNDGEALLKNVASSAVNNAACFTLISDVEGENYSKGDSVKLRILQKSECAISSKAAEVTKPVQEAQPE